MYLYWARRSIQQEDGCCVCVCARMQGGRWWQKYIFNLPGCLSSTLTSTSPVNKASTPADWSTPSPSLASLEQSPHLSVLFLKLPSKSWSFLGVHLSPSLPWSLHTPPKSTAMSLTLKSKVYPEAFTHHHGPQQFLWPLHSYNAYHQEAREALIWGHIINSRLMNTL